MQLLIQWPHSLYDEGYCAVIVSHDGDMATLLELAVYHVAWHSDSGLGRLASASGRLPQPPMAAVMKPDYAACPTCNHPSIHNAPQSLHTLDDFTLYKDGQELPRTGSLADAGITDRDWLTLDWAARLR